MNMNLLSNKTDSFKKHHNMCVTSSSRKVKVKLSLCLTKHHVMKPYWGVEV
jgi:hypothetical protein